MDGLNSLEQVDNLNDVNVDGLQSTVFGYERNYTFFIDAIQVQYTAGEVDARGAASEGIRTKLRSLLARVVYWRHRCHELHLTVPATSGAVY